jgi:hypothetical protein
VFDFRYHALSLVAVFLALGIGIVLGASLGDSVVTEANKDVRASLQGDVVNAREAADTARQAVANRDRFISASFDQLAGGELRRRRVAIVSSGGLPQEIESTARDAVDDGGGQIDSVSKLDARPDLASVGERLGGRYQALGPESDQLRSLTRRLGRRLVAGGALPRKLEDAFPDAFSGDFRGADAVVYYRADVDRDDPSERFEAALIDGLRASGTPVVGVEQSDEDPSQITFYVNAGLSTVDDVDQPAGRIALVLALTGAKGSFGFKDTADAPLPEPRRGGKGG